MAPVFVAVAGAALLINVLQVGVNFTSKPLIPKLSKLNPISGVARLFSMRSLNELFKSILKIAIIATIAYVTIRGKMDRLVLMVEMTPAQIGYGAMALAFEIFVKTVMALAILAFLDFAFQKWQFLQDMKMTKEEVKEEWKQTEGDPHVKARIRSLQREASRKRMMSSVPQADVVVTNPTHLAVALSYDSDKASAPIVVAKGRALLAEKIKQIARENNVPIVEDKPLAQALYKQVEVGEVIPILFYQAVAELLAYVYKLKGRPVYA